MIRCIYYHMFVAFGHLVSLFSYRAQLEFRKLEQGMNCYQNYHLGRYIVGGISSYIQSEIYGDATADR